MNRRRFLQVSGASAALALGAGNSALAGQATPQSPGERGWLIYVDERMGKAGEAFAQRLLAAAHSNPLLAALSAGKPVLRLNMKQAQSQIMEQLAYNHAILIAQADNPLLLQAWQREATVSAGGLYAFGFGNLHGSLGYIESDRNPFLHAANIAKAPFESQFITITGTDSRGASLAVEAFLSQSLVNGIVGRKGEWSRPTTTLLDRDPLPDSFTLPEVIPSSLGSLDRIAVTQASEDEYRGVLADTGFEPLWIWRAKYYKPGEWDAPGEAASFHNYSVGLHRRAYGNTVWAARFADATDASHAAQAIARAGRLSPNGSRWQGDLPPYAWGVGDADAPKTGSIDLWLDGASVLMATRQIVV